MAYSSFSFILSLSDDILLYIFQYLKAWDLVHLAGTCRRLDKVVRDRTLWVSADFRGQGMSLRELHRCLQFLLPTTRFLALQGKGMAQNFKLPKASFLSHAVIDSMAIKCPDLTEFSLVETVVNASAVPFSLFSSFGSLKRLTLEDCEFINLPCVVSNGSYFKGCQRVLPRLEFLELVRCCWLDDYDIMVLSKLEAVRQLTINSAPKVGKAMAYLALAFRFGFPNLECLDLRGTSLCDREVHSVVQSSRLTTLKLGPIGDVRRMSDQSYFHNSVLISRPQQQPEVNVVVVNLGLDGGGAQWRQVNDAEIDQMGLQWVRNAPALQAQKRRAALWNGEDDEHYFLDENGQPIIAPVKCVGAPQDGGESSQGGASLVDDVGCSRRTADASLMSSNSVSYCREITTTGINLASSEEDDTDEDHDEDVCFKVSANSQHCVHQSTAAEEPPLKRSRLMGPLDDESKNCLQNVMNDHPPEGENNLCDVRSDLCNEESYLTKGEKKKHESDNNCIDGGNNHQVGENGEENVDLSHRFHIQVSNTPDEELSDQMLVAFGQSTPKLCTLILAGCAITDSGVHRVLTAVPSLRYLDVSNSRVTLDGVEEARAAYPHCLVVVGGATCRRKED